MSDRLLPVTRDIMATAAQDIHAQCTIPATGPDKRLILACRDFAALQWGRDALWALAADDLAAEEHVQQQVELTTPDYEAALLRVCNLRATTVAGLKAKARVFQFATPQCDADTGEQSPITCRVMKSLVRDLLLMRTDT